MLNLFTNLILPNGSIHDAVFIATAHDSLYALDASNGDILWKDSFIDPIHGMTSVPANDVLCDDIMTETGIIGTPVIDRTPPLCSPLLIIDEA